MRYWCGRIRWDSIILGVAIFLLTFSSCLVSGDIQYGTIDVSYYKSEHINNTIPDMLEAGTLYPATITFRNSGMVSWDWGVEKFGMLYQGLQSSIGVEPEFSRLDNGIAIKSGDEITFPLILTPPEKPGDYTISFSMATLKGEDYSTFPESFSKKVQVISQDGISSGSVGSIILTSIPSGSQVFIGGDLRGVAPLTIPDLSPATYEVSVTAPEYTTKVIQVKVEPGSVSRLQVDMGAQGIPEVVTERDERYTLMGFLKANLPLLILTIAVLFFGIQMLMMDTRRFPENHPVRRFVKPITIIPVSFNGKLRDSKSGLSGSRAGSGGAGEVNGSAADPKRNSISRASGATNTKAPKPADKKAGYGNENTFRSTGAGEEEEAAKVDDVDQEYQDINNPFGFPDRLKDRYEPLGVAGDDTYARVFKVLKKENGSIRALKVSHSRNTGSELLQKESSVWGNLKHPNVVKLYKAEFDDDLSFLDVEYLEGIRYRGDTLTSLSALPKPVREKYAVSLTRDIATGLKYTHNLGIRHYHLQTGDILLTQNMRAKISGFARGKNELGFSVLESATGEATAAYIAPEQKNEVRYGNPGRKTDIYQLGVIFYELLTGYLPYSKDAAAGVGDDTWMNAGENRLILPSEIRRDLIRYDPIIIRMLTPDKKGRYSSVDELLTDLDALST